MTATAYVSDHTRTLRSNTERTRPTREPELPPSEERWTVGLYLREVHGWSEPLHATETQRNTLKHS